MNKYEANGVKSGFVRLFWQLPSSGRLECSDPMSLELAQFRMRMAQQSFAHVRYWIGPDT